MALSHHTFSCSEKYIAEQRGIDITPTDNTEKITFGMKQSLTFEMLSFFKTFKNKYCFVDL